MECIIFFRTKDNLTPLHLSIEHRLPEVVDSLCRRGVDMSVPNQQGHCPLWAALVSGQEHIASILVRYLSSRLSNNLI